MASDITPIRTIREQIAARLRSDILAGKLPRGSKLREQQLAERFGVSRGPIRDVLAQLAQQGLVTSEPNCGARVSEVADEWMQPLIVKLRREIEIFALKRSIGTIGAAQLAKLEGLVEDLGRACEKDDMALVAELDIAFHEGLLECAGEPDLVAIWLPIVTRMILHYTRLNDREEIHGEHVAILDAVRERDIDRAIKALEENVR
jgi:DNA-binding GntR family transcriptional regulator